MRNILIVARSEEACAGLSSILNEDDAQARIVTLNNGVRARSINPELFEIIIISTPLSDEFGLDLTAELSKKTKAAIIVIVKSEIAAEVQQKIKFTGAYVLARPFSKSAFLQAIRFSQVARENIQRLEEKNYELRRKLEDVKIVSRAKTCLIGYLGMSEEQAHRHIQKQAMDLRKTQRQIAEDILKTYLQNI